MSTRLNTLLTLYAAALASVSTEVAAYVGPGAGITAIGSILALLGGILLAVIGFAWYPLKRFFRSRFRNKDKDDNNQ